MRKGTNTALWAAVLLVAGAAAMAQRPQTAPTPGAQRKTDAGRALLFDLEARFARDVAAKGGAAFAEWFAEDGVMLGNGRPAAKGREAVRRAATWSPSEYQLTWTPTDAMMGPSGDMGYTWGHFEGRSKDADGKPVVRTGRYITMWRKEANGKWKVVLDAGSNESTAGE